MKRYKPKYRIGDITKWENENTCVHELVLGITTQIGVPTYTLLTLDNGEIDEDLDCEVYDIKSVKVA